MAWLKRIWRAMRRWTWLHTISEQDWYSEDSAEKIHDRNRREYLRAITQKAKAKKLPPDELL